MRRLVLVMLCAGCPAGDRNPSSIPDATPALPPGVWEPDPGVNRQGGVLVADGEDVWFAYQRSSSEIWWTKTTNLGAPLIAPEPVHDSDSEGWPAAITRTPGAVALVWKDADTLHPRLSMRSSSGEHVGAQGTEIPIAGIDTAYVYNVALTARPDGSLRMVGTYDDAPGAVTTEVGVVDIRADGGPAATSTLLGTANEATPYRVAAVDLAGTTVIAWDRVYDDCSGLGPNATLRSAVSPDGTAAAPIDLDPGGLGDWAPALATTSSAAYLAWTHVTDAGMVIRFQRVNGTATDIGLAPLQSTTPVLAFADDTHGALAWMTYEPALRIARLTLDGDTVTVSEPFVVPAPYATTLHGIVHVGQERYVVTWTDASSVDGPHLYAYTADARLSPTLSPAPPAPPPTPPIRRRCHF